MIHALTEGTNLWSGTKGHIHNFSPRWPPNYSHEGGHQITYPNCVPKALTKGAHQRRSPRSKYRNTKITHPNRPPKSPWWPPWWVSFWWPSWCKTITKKKKKTFTKAFKKPPLSRRSLKSNLTKATTKTAYQDDHQTIFIKTIIKTAI